MTFFQEAKKAWTEFHDEIEGELRESRELSDMASKLADHAARLAALFQVFEEGLDFEVKAKYFLGAA